MPVYLRMSLVFAAYGIGAGMFIPFFPVWMASRHLGTAEISAVLTAGMLARVFITPLIGRIADGLPDRRPAVIGMAGLSALAFVGLLSLYGFWAILIVSAIFAVFWQGILPVLDAVTLILARGGALEYGRARMWLSATYMVGNIGAGMLAAAVGMMIIMPSVQLCLVIFAAACLLVPRMPVAQRVENKGRLEWKLPFFLIILVAGLIQASHGLLYSFASLHWLALGYSNTVVGVFWAVSVVAEVIVFSCSALFLRYFGPLRLLFIAALGATVRWGLMSFDLGLGFQIGLQALHGVSFGMTYLAATRFIADTGPQARAASAQSLFGSVSGLSLAAATFGSGLLYARFDAMAFAAMAAISAAAAVLLLVVWQGAARLLAEPLAPADAPLCEGAVL